MKPTLLVLAAGMGSRYGGLKQMDGLGPNGETIIDYSIYDAVEAGFGKVVYIVREYFKEQMEEVVKAKYSNVKCVDGEPLQFEFVTQELFKIPSQFTLNPEREKPWGTAHAVLMAKDVIKEPFAVINGDDYYGKESFKVLGDWLRAHENKTCEYALVGFELDNTLSESGSVSRGIGTADNTGFLTSVVEHHKIAKAEDGIIYGENNNTGEKVTLEAKSLCSMNMWGFTPDYFEKSEAIFTAFLEKNIGELKAEFYIPFVIDSIASESALQAGLQQGDRIIGVGDKAIPHFGNYAEQLALLKGSNAELKVVRGADTIALSVPVNAEGKLGVLAKEFTLTDLTSIHSKEYGFFESFAAGARLTASRINNYWTQLVNIVKPDSELYKEVGGFIAIGNIFPAEWDWYQFWSMTAFLSIILAVMNIIPIPGLDGGHMLFTLWEMITRRKVSEKVLTIAQYIGMALILGLVLFANGNDIYKLFVN